MTRHYDDAIYEHPITGVVRESGSDTWPHGNTEGTIRLVDDKREYAGSNLPRVNVGETVRLCAVRDKDYSGQYREIVTLEILNPEGQSIFRYRNRFLWDEMEKAKTTEAPTSPVQVPQT